MGEVRFIWAEPDNHSSQIQISALVQAMLQKDFVALVRTVDKANSQPKVGVCRPVVDSDQLHYMYWVQVSTALNRVTRLSDTCYRCRCHSQRMRDPFTFPL